MKTEMKLRKIQQVAKNRNQFLYMQKVNATVSEILQRNGTLADVSSHIFPHNIASSLPRASQKGNRLPLHSSVYALVFPQN